MNERDFDEQYEERGTIFESQDPESPCFNVIFNVEGRPIYADQMTLASASSEFKKLFIKHGKPDEPVNQPIRINGYTYDEFYRFLEIIYYGFFEPNDKNVHFLLELATTYDIYWIIRQCDRHMSDLIMEEFDYGHNEDDEEENDINLTVANIKEFYDRLEFANDFRNMNDFNESLGYFLKKRFSALIEYNDFVNLDEDVIKALVAVAFSSSTNDKQKEKLSEAVYKWGKHQAMIQDDTPKEESEEAILHQLSDILPCFKFELMNIKFLFDFFVGKSLLSIDEVNRYKVIEVQITCRYSKIRGSFVDDYGIFEVINSNKNEKLIDRGEKKRCFWDKTFKRPSKPSELKKMKGVQWYLAFDINGKLNLKHQSLIKKTDYLIAEMKPRDGVAFVFETNRQVYATVSRKK